MLRTRAWNLVIVLGVLLGSLGWVAPPAMADDDEEEVFGKWFYFETTGSYYRVDLDPTHPTWDEASTHAEAIGAHLVTITSQEENDFVVSLLTSAECWGEPDPYGSAPGPWMGGLQTEGAAEPTGGWTWVTGEPFEYTHWASGEPNNFPESGANENRMLFWGPGDSQAGVWNDAREDYGGTVAYVMEISAVDCNGNGTPDEDDVSGGTSTDCNNNKVPDECEADRDEDGLIDGCDNCRDNVNPDQADADEDGVGDVCDECPGRDDTADCDENGTPDCLQIESGEGTDCDHSGTMDSCELNATNDSDGDGVLYICDNCPLVSNPDQADTDTDDVGDVCDECPEEDDKADYDGDGYADCRDGDGDGLRSDEDNCPGIANADQADADGDGVGDPCDARPGQDDNAEGYEDDDGESDYPSEDEGDGYEGDEETEETDEPNTSTATNDDGEKVTAESPEGTILSDLLINPVSEYETPPEGVEFNFGVLEFTISDVTPGGGAVVVLTFELDYDAVIKTYYKYGPTLDNATPHWYEFLYDGETGAEIDGNVVTLHLLDGSTGDDALTANGQIVEPGAPVVSQSVSSGGGGGGSSSGGLCGMGLLPPLVILLAGLGVVRRVRAG